MASSTLSLRERLSHIVQAARHCGKSPSSAANLIVLGTAAAALLTSAYAPDLFHALSQEDHLVEWATVWAFLFAAALYGRAMLASRAAGNRLPWFHASMTLLCFFVAMEEMSWGQRLVTYRPPTYFLEGNYQQELNLHNFVESRWRQLALQTVILGYGVCLPLISLFERGRAMLATLRIAPPAPALIPAFAATSALYHVYPLEFTGEWVECMLGLSLLFAAASLGTRGKRRPPGVLIALTVAGPVALAGVTLWITTTLFAGSPANLATAAKDTARLAEDFGNERVATRCGVHKRIHTFAREYGQHYLYQGDFAGVSADPWRARYFLDPWNMPYWVRHSCTDGQAQVWVYSFGPNRRRDSDAFGLAGDDIGHRVTPFRR